MKAGPPAQFVGVEVHEQQEALAPQSSVPLPAASNSPARPCDCLAHVYGNAGDRGKRVRRYPSDTTDAEWAVVRDLLPVLAWMNGKGGQPEGYCHRQMIGDPVSGGQRDQVAGDACGLPRLGPRLRLLPPLA